MDNQEAPHKNEQSMGSEDSPVLSQIGYELSDSSTAKPDASKPSGAYNTNYNAAKHAAKVVSKEQFSLMDVHLNPDFSTMGDTSGLYNRTEAAKVVCSNQEDIPTCNSIGLEQFHVSMYHCV